ncbi:hypothetical protein SAMN05192553_102729 [Cyclobacterium xiamenense]|uniref:Uncharacterized protein n=1 Tax=Cyclobacterium xiamenense TaxID=1297121 RepID=A0A1H6WWA6_9BACT|nr:hypothetical protein [Cyclobacterium xiamenense]SEJ16752.1 hypothetical protein SAMN05192553_102729 [Cyclobacterium xiamenense]
MTGKVKHILVIESLDESDGVHFTGEALYNDIIRRRIDLYGKDFTHQFHKVNSKESFSQIIKYVQYNANFMQEGVVIHFEMHGDNALEGLVLSNGELIKWEEICNLLRPINVATKNKLFVTMGTCNGRFLYKGVDPYRKSPYSGYISASKTVKPEEIYTKFGLLFEHLIENGNIVDSYLEMEKSESNFYYKDSKRVFKEAFSKTMENLANDSGLKEEILKDSIEQTKMATGKEFNKQESEVIFKKALKDIYNNQLKAFDFEEE